MSFLTIGKVAKRADVGIETVRFYEREGLLESPRRLPSGYRQYSEDTVAVLCFIKRAKELGFTLKEIKALLALRLDQSGKRADIKKQALLKMADISARIQDLQRIHQSLSKLTASCDGRGSLKGCPILQALEHTRLENLP